MRCSFTPSARRDLGDIWDHVAASSSDSADRLIDSLYDRFLLLAQHPPMGEPRPDLGDNLRQFTVGSYVIFYSPTQRGIRVIRVLHGSRDIPALFRREE